MKTITEEYKASYRDRGSRFLGYLLPASNQNQFEARLEQLRREFHDATHHCYAWRLHPHDIKEFAQDDGEPGGTAGLPILNQLKSHEVVNCGCIVVRYYGGSKLGKRGLIHAYGTTAEQCFRKAHLHTLITTVNFEIQYPYPEQRHIDRLKTSFDLKELDAEYLEQVTLKIACRREQASAFSKALEKLGHNNVSADRIEESYIHMPDSS